MGSSPATGPTQNIGADAQAVQMAATVVELLVGMVQRVGATSEIGKSFLKAVQDISKHVPPGSASQQAKTNQIRQLMMRQQQMGPQLAALQAQQGAAGQSPMPQPPAGGPQGA